MSRQPISLTDIDPKCLARIAPTLRQPGNIEIDTAGRLSPKPRTPQEAVSGQSRAGTAEIATTTKKGPNKTEAHFGRMLEARMRAGEFSEVAYEPFALPIEGGMTYRPDWVAVSREAPFTISQLSRLANSKAITAGDNWELASLIEEFLRRHGDEVLACFFEVKGAHIWDKNLNKFKQARDRYRWGRFEMWQLAQGEWREKYSSAEK